MKLLYSLQAGNQGERCLTALLLRITWYSLHPPRLRCKQDPPRHVQPKLPSPTSPPSFKDTSNPNTPTFKRGQCQGCCADATAIDAVERGVSAESTLSLGEMNESHGGVHMEWDLRCISHARGSAICGG